MSLWQQGCDDAKAGRPRQFVNNSGRYNGYTNGYNHGLEVIKKLPEYEIIDPGVYKFPDGTIVTIPWI